MTSAVASPETLGRSVERRHSRGLVVVLVVLSLLSVAAPGTFAQSNDLVVRTWDGWFESHDGTQLAVRLHYPSYLRPDSATASVPHPVIIGAHGWGDDKDQLNEDGFRLAESGFIVLAYDARGYGESEGVVTLNGPAEVADVAALIDWVAAWSDDDRLPSDLPAVAMDAPDDPRLGMVGLSYGGAIQWLAALEDDRIDAIVPEITWSDLSRALQPNGVIKQRWLDLLFFGGTFAAHAENEAGPDADGLDSNLGLWYAEATATGRFPTEAEAALRERSPVGRLANLTADVLIIQGTRDTLFPPEEGVAAYLELVGAGNGSARVSAGAHTSLLIHDAGHGFALQGSPRAPIDAAQDEFLAAVLLDDDPERALAVVPPVRVVEGDASRFLEVGAWPPDDVRATSAAVQRAFVAGSSVASGAVEVHQAPVPTTHTETTNFESDHGAGAVSAPAPTWALFETDLLGPKRLIGDVGLVVDVETAADDITLFVSLVLVPAGVDPQDASTVEVLDGQVVPFRLSAGACAPCTLALGARDVSVPLGASLGVRIATSDSAYASGRMPASATIALDGMLLDVMRWEEPRSTWTAPVVADEERAEATLPAPNALLVLVVATLVACAIRVRRAR